MRNFVSIAKEAIKRPWKIIIFLGHTRFKYYIPDSLYIKCMYRETLGKKLNLNNPQTFNEKLNWLKLHDHKPIYTTMVDKYEAKKYVASIIGEEYIIPTLGVWDHFDQIDFDSLPEQFVLKCTHDSAGLVIVKDKNKFDKNNARVKIEKCLSRNFFYNGREWPYKNVKPRIIAEKYMEDHDSGELYDYKFFCFSGVAKCFKVDFDRFIEHHANYYYTDCSPMKFGEKICPPDLSKNIVFPQNIEKMKELAEVLSKEIPFLRCDFYSIDESIYFGELTFYPDSGFGKFIYEDNDQMLGQWVMLPNTRGGGGYLLVYEGNLCILHPSIRKEELLDYKFYCFNGEPKFLYVGQANFINGEKHDLLKYFNLDWSLPSFSRPDHPELNGNIEKPESLQSMIDASRLLSKGTAFLRVDFYNINKQLYFSELTFFPGSGLGLFYPESWELELGKWIDISDIK